jgi:hypothetical protein
MVKYENKIENNTKEQKWEKYIETMIKYWLIDYEKC